MADKEIMVGGTNVRSAFRDLEPNNSDENTKAYAQYFSLGRATPLGHETFTVGNSAIGLPSLPNNVKRLQIYAFGNQIFYTDHGVDPDSDTGFPIPADTVFVYDSDVNASFRLWAASDTEVRVAYYG